MSRVYRAASIPQQERPSARTSPAPLAGTQPNSTQHFENITAADNVRLHVGNSYNIQHHHHGVAHINGADEVSKDAPSGSEAEFLAAYLGALAYPQMNLRSSTIATAYADTCQWFFRTPEYKRWRNTNFLARHHGILWVKGNPGTGKSTLMKCALRHSRESHQGELQVSFFFNARGEGLEASTEGLYRALLYQLRCIPSPHMVKRETFGLDIKNGWPLEQLKDLLREAIDVKVRERPVTIYIDALDEGDEDDIRDLIDFFGELAVETVLNKRLLLCLASRHYPRISVEHCEEFVLDHHQGHDGDITAYIRSKLKLRRSTFNDELASRIRQRAAGIFLWVVLVIGILNRESDQGNHHSIAARLEQTPNGLNNIFDDLLKEADAHTGLLPVIQWAMFALTPLKPEQLYYAMMSSIDHLNAETVAWNRSIVDDRTVTAFIVSSSRGLLEVTSNSSPDSRRVQFIHESVREYMLNHGLCKLDPSIADNVEARSHECLAQWSRIYLRQVIDSGIYISRFRPTQSSHSSVSTWHGFKHEEHFPWPFLEYALEGALAHAEIAANLGLHQELDHDVPLDEWLHLQSLELLPDDENHELARLSTMLQMLVAKGCRWLTYFALHRIACLVDEDKHGYLDAPMIIGDLAPGFSALHLAVMNGHTWIAHALIKSGANPNSQSHAGTPLHVLVNRSDAATLAQKTELVDILVAGGGDINAAHGHLGSVLQTAVCERADAKLIGMLLERGAHPDAWSPLCHPALHDAVRMGALAIVVQLLQHGANPDLCYDHEGTCLGIAIRMQDFEMVRTLLVFHADPNKTHGVQPSTLHDAVNHGGSHIVELLLSYGATVDVYDVHSGTPLNLAISNVRHDRNHPSDRARTIRLLLKHGCNIDIPIGEWGNAMNAASCNNDWLSMRCLGQHGVFVDAEDFSMRGPYNDPEEARRICDDRLCRAPIIHHSFLPRLTG